MKKRDVKKKGKAAFASACGILPMSLPSLEETVRRIYLCESTNCAETLILACDEVYQLGLPRKQASILMSGFGSGLYTGNVCGALCACNAALSCLLVEDKAHLCEPLRASQAALVRNFKNHVGDTQCAKCKMLHHSKEERCLKTVTLAAQVMEQTVAELQEKGFLQLPAELKSE